MKLKSLNVFRFKSYEEQQELDISDLPPGLYHVSGVNGSGKSTLFDFVHWVWFGETSRGLKASNIGTWSQKKGSVGSLVFDTGTVSRSWSPNFLRFNGKEMDQKTLEAKLHLTPEVVLNTCHFGQFTSFFLDLPPPQRMALYSEVLQLGHWEERSAETAELAKKVTQEIQGLERSRDAIASKIELLEKDKSGDLAIAWGLEHAKSQKALADEIEKLGKARAGIASQLEPIDASEGKAGKSRILWNKKIEELSDAVTGVKGQIIKETTNLEGLEREEKIRAAQYKSRLTSLEDLTASSVCPTCAQPFSKKLLAAQAKNDLARLDTTRRSVKELKKVIDINREELAELTDLLAAAKKHLRKLDELLAKAKSDAYILREQLSRKTEQRRLKQEALKELKVRENPHKAEADIAARRLRSFTLKKAALEKEIQEQTQTKSYLEYWVKGFKDIRYQVLTESLTQLNAEVNECLHDLGLSDWELEFSVETETKTGTIKRGFQCLVSSPNSPGGAVPWEAWSGGESQRLKVGAQMGVANMLEARLGLELDFEFWDEPSNFMENEGIKDLLGLLKDRATQYSKRIFLADHRALDFNFDGVLYVVKDSTGSSTLNVSQLRGAKYRKTGKAINRKEQRNE